MNAPALVSLSSAQVAGVASVAAQRSLLEEARKRLVEANGKAVYEVRGTVDGTTSPVGDISLSELLLVFDARLAANAVALRAYGIEVEAAPTPLLIPKNGYTVVTDLPPEAP